MMKGSPVLALALLTSACDGDGHGECHDTDPSGMTEPPAPEDTSEATSAGGTTGGTGASMGSTSGGHSTGVGTGSSGGLTGGGTGSGNAQCPAGSEVIATGNDVAALQAAIDGAVPGGVVCLESGDHSVEETIFVYGSVHVLGLDGAHLTQTFVGDLFEVSATDVTIENLGMTGANRDRTGEECSGTTAIRDWGSVNLSIVDNAIDTFTCGIQINDTDGFEISGNEVSNIGYTGIGTFPAFHGTIEGNVVEDVNPGGMLDECAYGIVTSGLATVSSAITVTGNTVDQARTWECFDNHDGNAIDFLGNTCIAPGRVGINVVNAGVAEPTGRVEGNTIDAAGITAQWNSIYHGGPGTVLNNIIIGFGSEPCRVQAPLATVSGNTCQ